MEIKSLLENHYDEIREIQEKYTGIEDEETYLANSNNNKNHM